MSVWHGSPAIGGSPDPATSADQSRKARIKASIKEWSVTLFPVVVIVSVCYVGVTLFFNWVQSVANGFANIGQGFDELGQAMAIGGTTADAAASVAATQPPGSPSVAELNAKLPKYAWVDGTINVPSSTLKRPIVGVNIVGTDVETAVQIAPGWCSYGLSVTSSSDHLIARDHLVGPGTYYQFVLHPPPPASPCIANQAPTSSWMTLVRTP